MRKHIWTAGLLTTTLVLAGCLNKEATHTLYLSPDGEVAWTALERNVRSDETDARARSAEESEYLTAAETGTTGVARGLAALGPLRVKTRVLRGDRPFTVLTEAQFASVEALANRIIAECRLQGEAHVTRDLDATTLHIHLELASADEADNQSPVMALLEELSAYRIVLTQGRFVAATGFSLSGDSTIATPIAPEDERAKGTVDLSLTWR